MATTSNDIVKKPTKLGSYLRNAPVSAGLREQDWTNLAEFLISLDFDVWDFDDLDDLDRVLGDIEFIGRTSTLSEGVLRAKKSTSSKRAYARKWYKKNKGRLAARRHKLKNNISAKAKQKKKERLRRQRKNLNKKPIRKYPSAKNNSNESGVTFAELVKPLSEKQAIKEDYSNKDKPRYFIPDKTFMLNEMKISAGQKFILIGTDLILEVDGKKYKIDDPVPVIPYLKEI